MEWIEGRQQWIDFVADSDWPDTEDDLDLWGLIIDHWGMVRDAHGWAVCAWQDAEWGCQNDTTCIVDGEPYCVEHACRTYGPYGE